jgi:hypothetical protein
MVLRRNTFLLDWLFRKPLWKERCRLSSTVARECSHRYPACWADDGPRTTMVNVWLCWWSLPGHKKLVQIESRRTRHDRNNQPGVCTAPPPLMSSSTTKPQQQTQETHGLSYPWPLYKKVVTPTAFLLKLASSARIYYPLGSSWIECHRPRGCLVMSRRGRSQNKCWRG